MPTALSQEVYTILLERLLKNELIPGVILNRRKVAAELGVSVAPVLEAMLQLEIEGFLESIPRKGTQVRLITPENIWGQLVVREALECQAARLYCGDPIEKNEAKLLELAIQVDRTSLNTLEHWRVDIEFHQALIRLTECDTLINEYHRVIRLNLFYTMNRFISHYERAEIGEHRALISGLKTRDPDEAEKTVREHIRRGKSRLFSRGKNSDEKGE